ncbi:hypothetical protein YC2023_017856 [Brassica napus]
MGEQGDTLENSEDIQDVLSCTSIQRIRRILFTINFPYLDAFTPFTCKESLHQLMAKEQRPYSSSKPFRDISGRLLLTVATSRSCPDTKAPQVLWRQLRRGFVCIHPWRCRSEVVGSSLTYQLGGRRCESKASGSNDMLSPPFPSGRARYLERLCGCFLYVVCVCKKSLEFQGCDLKEKFRVSRMCRLWLLLLFSCFAPLVLSSSLQHRVVLANGVRAFCFSIVCFSASLQRGCRCAVRPDHVLCSGVSTRFQISEWVNWVLCQCGDLLEESPSQCAADCLIFLVLVGSPRVCYLLPLSFQHLELHSQWRRKVWEDRHELTPVMARDISSTEETR